MNNLEFTLFNFTFYLLGRSLLRLFKRDKISDEEKIFETKIFIFYTLFGVLFISATTFLLNFFLPLKQYKSYLIAIILLLLLLNIKDISVPKNKIFFLFNYLITPLIIGFSSYNIKFHYDSDVYHLATQSWIINSKIVFGLSKYFIWLGHSSIYEYAQAFLNFGENFIYQHYLNLLFINFLINFLSYHLIFNQKSLFFNISLFVLIYGILDNFGFGGGSNGFIQIQMVGKPDVSVGILFFLISIFIIQGIYKKSPNKFEVQILLLLFTYLIQLRIISVVLIFLLIPYIYKNFRIVKEVLFSSFSIVLIVYNVLWVLKNIIISTCIFFPVKFTCLNSLSWNIQEELSKNTSWVYAYKFDRPFLEFIEEWFNTGHNSQQVPNLLFSFLFLFLVKKLFFSKNDKKYIFLYLNNIFLFLIALYFTFHIRYWFGLVLLFIGTLAINMDLKEKFNFMKSKVLIYILFLILSVGIPRGHSYKYFINNFGYYALTINYDEDEFIKNEDGYGVVAQNNNCFNKFNCSTFQFRENTNIKLKKFLGDYYIFSE